MGSRVTQGHAGSMPDSGYREVITVPVGYGQFHKGVWNEELGRYSIYGPGDENTLGFGKVSPREAANSIAAMRGRNAFVYIAAYPALGCVYVKVGMSGHPEKRRQVGETFCPFERAAMYLCATSDRDSAYALEKSILRKHENNSVRGEWLQFTDMDAFERFLAHASGMAEQRGHEAFVLDSSSPAP
jgi:hypothetical protein